MFTFSFKLTENFNDSEISLESSLEILRENVTDCFINFKEKDDGKNHFTTDHIKNTYENSVTGGLSVSILRYSVFVMDYVA